MKKSVNCKSALDAIYIICVVCLLPLFASCSNDKPETVKAETRDSLPRLKADTIVSIVSDSGITRFRVNATEWLIFDRTAETYWDFPEGILFEKFDEALQVNASMQANQAIYYDKKQLWDFRGNVKATNLEGETFETEQLFWDDANERIYSDDSIRITQKSKIINGIGFESNTMLTRYTIKKPTGVIPVDEEEESDE